MRILFTLFLFWAMEGALAQDSAKVQTPLPVISSPAPKFGMWGRAISKEAPATHLSIAMGLHRADYWFRLQLPRREQPVNLCLYDAHGQLLARLYSEERLGAGCHLSNWQIPEALGGPVFYILQVGAHWQTGQLD